jgi:transcriptional regulator with XRE-family HTH domain
MPEPTEGPTVLRILLGTQLRRLRESRGITAQEAARAIRGSESKISRIELGRNAIREIDVLDLLTYDGVGAVEREQLLSLIAPSSRMIQASSGGSWSRRRCRCMRRSTTRRICSSVSLGRSSRSTVRA